MGMKWLITGGCGFLGTSLIARLKAEGGHSVRVLDNLSVGNRDDLKRVSDFTEQNEADLTNSDFAADQCTLVVGDIMDEKLAVDVTKGADVIVHFAANTGVGPSVEDPRMDCLANVIGTFNYLEAARANNIKNFVFASSGAPVGEVEPPIHEEMPPHPVSPYGASKLAGEGYCSAYYNSFGIDAVMLRFGNVYGPLSGHKSSVVAKFIRQALAGETLEIYGNGQQTRDFIYIDDLVDAVYRAATTPDIGGEAFQIATHAETTVGEMTELLVTCLKKHTDKNIKIFNGETRLGDVMRNFSDVSKARKVLGWSPKVELPDGLQRTVSWFCDDSSK